MTGAAGFVGRNLVAGLSSNKEIELHATDVRRDVAVPSTNVSFLDVSDSAAVFSALIDADIVVHLATHPLVPSLSDPELNARVNIMGMLNILEAARKTKIKKVIFSSASSIIGDVLHNPVDEKHPCNPKTPYAVTKLACEHYLKVYQNLFGLDYVVFRFFNIYGPYQPEGLIPSIYRKIMARADIDVYGDGKQMRDYVYVHDLNPIFEKAILGSVRNVILNAGTGKGSTVLEVIELAGKILQRQPKMKFNPPRPGEIQNFVASTDMLRAELGMVPTTSIEDGLSRTFGWLNANCRSSWQSRCNYHRGQQP